MDGSSYVGQIFIDPSGGIYVGTFCTFKGAATQDGTYYRQIGDIVGNLGQGWTTADWQSFMRAGTRQRPGTTSNYKTFAGDAAADWSYAKKFAAALAYAVEHGTLGDEVNFQLQQIQSLATDPEALVRLVAMIAATAAAKKAACRYGPSDNKKGDRQVLYNIKTTGPDPFVFSATCCVPTVVKTACQQVVMH